MWTYKIKLDKMIVVRGQAHKKEDCLWECMRYTNAYLGESFDKAVVEIKKEVEK